jgi:hypothetical protein
MKYNYFNTNNLAILIVLFLFTSFLMSCGEEPYRLDSRDRTIIDSTSNKMIENLAAILEDSCKRNFDHNVQRLTDSLVEFQIKEIDKKLHTLDKTAKKK